MTRYYEAEATRLESLASESNDPAEQSRLWDRAARIGTPVEFCQNGGACPLPYRGYSGRCACDDKG